jgi:hypothetical protein
MLLAVVPHLTAMALPLPAGQQPMMAMGAASADAPCHEERDRSAQATVMAPCCSWGCGILRAATLAHGQTPVPIGRRLAVPLLPTPAGVGVEPAIRPPRPDVPTI